MNDLKARYLAARDKFYSLCAGNWNKFKTNEDERNKALDEFLALQKQMLESGVEF